MMKIQTRRIRFVAIETTSSTFQLVDLVSIFRVRALSVKLGFAQIFCFILLIMYFRQSPMTFFAEGT
jgi:hypothetical protein